MPFLMAHLRIGLIVATILLIVACTAKLQQNSNSNSTKKEALTNVSAKDDSIITALKERDALFGESVTNYTYIPPRDTPVILKKDNPFWKIGKVGGRYEGFWRLFGRPNEIRFTPEEFMQKYLLPNIGISKINELRYTHKSKKDENGFEYLYYTQYYKGLPTTHQCTITTKNGFALGFDSSFDPTLQLNIVPTITEQQALDSIKILLAATDTKSNFKKYWAILDNNSKNEFPYDKQLIDEMKYKLTLQIEWNGDRAIDFRKGAHLVYKFDFTHPSAIFQPTVIVDPFVGKIIGYGSGNYACTHTAIVDTKYGLPLEGIYPTYGNKSFCVEGTPDNYTLEDASRNIKTLTYLSGTNYNYIGSSIQYNSLDWNNYPNTAYPSTHWAIQEAYDHFQTTYGHIIECPIQIFVNCPFVAPQAYSGYYQDPIINSLVYKIYLGKNEPSVSKNINSLDNIGHEFSHSIRSETSLPVAYFAGASATATEAFCDILGATFEYNITNTYSWLFVDKLSNNSAYKRSFSHPHTAGTCHYNSNPQAGQAAFVSEYTYWNGDEYIDKYERVSIIDHWFYLLTHGTPTPGGNKYPYADLINNETHVAVPDGYADPYNNSTPTEVKSIKVEPINADLSIAIDKGAKIVFDVFKNKLIVSDQFIDIAKKSIISAVQKDYSCEEIRSIYNAWRAVGIYIDMSTANIWLPIGTVLPTGCNTPIYNWATSCTDFDPNDISFAYICNEAYDNVYQLLVTDNSGYNGPYSYEVAGLGTYFVPDNSSSNFLTIPLLQDYAVTVTNSNGCSVTYTGVPDNDACTTINTVCDFNCTVYAEGSICDMEDGGVYLNFYYDTDATIENINMTYNGTDWTTVEGINLVGTDNFTIYFEDYQVGNYIYYYATDINGCLTQGSFMPACNGNEPAPNQSPVFLSIHEPIELCYGTTEELCIYYEITDPDADYPLTVYYNTIGLDMLEPTTISSTGSATELASGQICFTGGDIPTGFSMHVFDNRGAHTFQGQTINFSTESENCDNHLPYLRSIKVIDGTTIISQQEWQDDGTERCLVNEILQQETDFSTPLHIEVTASEPLTNLVFKGFSFGNYLVGPNIEILTTNNTNTYSFDIPIIANGVNIPHLAQLNFIGTDLSGNQLEALQTYPLSNQQNCLNLSDVPNHNTDGTWTPPPHNTENDKSFSLTTNHCNFDFTISNSLFIGTLYCTGTQYYSYSIKDNETNQWVIEDCLIVSNFGFVTAGILPHNYTLEVTNTSGCIKSITGTWEEPNGCVFRLPSNDPNAHVKIDNTYCYPIGDGNYQIAMVPSDDLEGINQITIDISGLIDQDVSLGQANCCPTVTITIPEAVINYELPYTITMTGTNACKYYGTVKCSDNITPPVGVSGTGYCETPTFDYATGTEPIAYINACSGQEICLPYHVYCSNTAAISIVTPVPYLVHQNTTSTNTGTFCFTPDDSYIGTHQIKLMAANLDCPYTWKLAERLFELNVTCCPTTFTTTTTTPAYIGCNGALLLGGTATLISDASCLTPNFSIC